MIPIILHYILVNFMITDEILQNKSVILREKLKNKL